MKWKKWLKTLAALVLALAILNVFCFFWYNPAGYLWDADRATDTIREAGVFTARANEGFSCARTDEFGYNNAQIPDENGVFVLMMGSSHTEGYNLMPDENVSSLLSSALQEKGMDVCVYNIGTSGHKFVRNAANLDRALKRFQPTGFVVMETQQVIFGQTSVENAMNDSFDRLPWTKPILGEWLSRQPLLRTLYRQFELLLGGEDGEEGTFEATAEQLSAYETALTELMRKLKTTADQYNVELIIYYHPHLYLQEDGSALPEEDAGCKEAFACSCDAAGVRFLDMTDVFMNAYAQQSVLPHGFANTSPGSGHLNKHGSQWIADALCAEILKGDAGK